jgi:hypothetical protein
MSEAVFKLIVGNTYEWIGEDFLTPKRLFRRFGPVIAISYCVGSNICNFLDGLLYFEGLFFAVNIIG